LFALHGRTCEDPILIHRVPRQTGLAASGNAPLPPTHSATDPTDDTSEPS
jgi:hypothetical protein